MHIHVSSFIASLQDVWLHVSHAWYHINFKKEPNLLAQGKQGAQAASTLHFLYYI